MGALDMNPEIRTQWTEALRSGAIPQADGALRDGDARCCLGVLCDLAVRAGAIEDAVVDGADGPGPRWYYDGESQVLPVSVAQWAGLSEPNPTVIVQDEVILGVPVTISAWGLAELNDDGWTFAKIADAIEDVAPEAVTP
jgi:hypothetical protein